MDIHQNFNTSWTNLCFSYRSNLPNLISQINNLTKSKCARNHINCGEKVKLEISKKYVDLHEKDVCKHTQLRLYLGRTGNTHKKE